MTFDPIGPGTPAWTAFDEAVRAYASCQPGTRFSNKNPAYKRYANQRQYMIQVLKRAGAGPTTIAQWKWSLRQACLDPIDWGQEIEA